MQLDHKFKLRRGMGFTASVPHRAFELQSLSSEAEGSGATNGGPRDSLLLTMGDA